MLDLYIVGAGGLGRGLADALSSEHDNLTEPFDKIYFIDDYQINEVVNGIEVKYGLNDFIQTTKSCLVVNAIGSPNSRRLVQEKLNTNKYFIFPNYIDRDVRIYKNIELGIGNILSRGVVLSTNIKIGDFNLIHFNSTIGHDVEMCDFNCIYPLSSLSGYTKLGKENLIGTGSCTLPNAELHNNVIVGANSLVRGVYESNQTIVGSPSERIN